MNKNRETVFHFKQFSLSNSLSAMKVGTDGVLLGAWARVPVAAADRSVLDVGCGTGVIGLMIAQRYSWL
ncbi:MAG: methyltransferase [Muribaculaceae bacterium]|nr:methyltransferase [Muribaculaceae bacterium]